jgi:HD-GYP domain-containing protein (c-di-GMP phosphodiesterase class II)
MANSENGIIRIHVYELRVGMWVSRLETLEKDSSFLFEQFDIKNKADIQAIQAVCDYVFIDVERQKRSHGSIPTGKSTAKQQLGFARSFDQAAQTYQNTSNLIKSVMDDIRFGNQLNVTAVKTAVSDCVDKVLENSDAMLLLTQLKNMDQYTSQHSLNVCILAILVGRELKLTIKELNDLGLCGLMHDIGKMKIPLEILNKPGKLEAEELVIMRRHAGFGRDILISARGIYPGAVDVAYSHHEHLTGTGYPRGVDKTALTLFTKIVAVVDTYDAITSDRVYQIGRPHLIALGILTKAMHAEFDSQIVTQFINCIGFYPQGNIVELSSGEIGIVVEQNTSNRLKPKILLLFDQHKNAINERILDMAMNISDSTGALYKIKQIVRPEEYNIDLIKFQQDGKFTQQYELIV